MIAFRYKRIVISLVIALLIATSVTPIASANNRFKDVPEWAAQGVQWMVDNKITLGFKDGTFRPNQKLTEKEFIYMLSRSLKTTSYQKVLQDMNNPDWSKTVNQVAKNYQMGSSENKSAIQVIESLNLPINKDLSRDITRGEVAQVFTKALTGKYVSERDAIQFLINNGYTSAKDVASYKASGTLLRSEISAFLQRIGQYPVKDTGQALKELSYQSIHIDKVSVANTTEESLKNQYVAQRNHYYNTVMPRYKELQAKYPVYTVAGTIKSVNPFYVWGVAVSYDYTSWPNLTSNSNILVKNPEEDKMMYGQYVYGSHYFIEQTTGTGNFGQSVPVYVFGGAPKELLNYQQAVNTEENKLTTLKNKWITEVKKNNLTMKKSNKDYDYLHAALRLAAVNVNTGENVDASSFYNELPRNELVANFIMIYADLLGKKDYDYYYHEAVQFDHRVVFDYIKTPEQHYYAADALFDYNNTGENVTLISNALQIALTSKDSTIVRYAQSLMKDVEGELAERQKVEEDRLKKEGITLTKDELSFFGPDGIVVTPLGSTVDLYKKLTQMGDYISIQEYGGGMEAVFKGSSNRLYLDVHYDTDYNTQSAKISNLFDYLSPAASISTGKGIILGTSTIADVKAAYGNYPASRTGTNYGSYETVDLTYNVTIKGTNIRGTLKFMGYSETKDAPDSGLVIMRMEFKF